MPKVSRLIAYDIRDDRRLGRVFRHLKSVAIPLQYSVFLQVYPTLKAEKETEEFLAATISRSEDDVRIYPLPENCSALRIGKAFLSPGLALQEEWMKEFLMEKKFI